MKRSLEMPVADGRTDGTEFIGPLSALPGVQRATINPKNMNDDRCFQYALTVALSYGKIKNHPEEQKILSRLLINIIGMR